MGVRLYPNTANVASLEILAGVAPGTAQRFAELTAKHDKENNYQEVGYRQWQEINNDSDMGAYSAFLLFGYGKFRSISGLGEGYSGSLTDAKDIETLFVENYFDTTRIKYYITLMEGVHWC